MLLRNIYEGVHILRCSNVAPICGNTYCVRLTATAYQEFLQDPELLPYLVSHGVQPNMFALEFPGLGFHLHIEAPLHD